jgi:hypothetical protein
MDSSNDREPNTAAALIAVGIIVLALACLTLLALALSHVSLGEPHRHGSMATGIQLRFRRDLYSLRRTVFGILAGS